MQSGLAPEIASYSRGNLCCLLHLYAMPALLELHRVHITQGLVKSIGVVKQIPINNLVLRYIRKQHHHASTSLQPHVDTLMAIGRPHPHAMSQRQCQDGKAFGHILFCPIRQLRMGIDSTCHCLLEQVRRLR